MTSFRFPDTWCGNTAAHTGHDWPYTNPSLHCPGITKFRTDMILQPKETSMNKIEVLQAALEKEIERQARIDALPDFSEFENGSVIYFSVEFRGNPTAYTYAATKIKDHWYLTGATQLRTGYTDQALRDWLASDNKEVNEIWYATEWEQVL